MLVALTIGQKFGLGGVAAVFIAFSLASALLFPRWWPDFPGRGGRGWFVVATVVLLIAMLAAVELFAVEDEELEQQETTEALVQVEVVPGSVLPGSVVPGSVVPRS